MELRQRNHFTPCQIDWPNHRASSFFVTWNLEHTNDPFIMEMIVSHLFRVIFDEFSTKPQNWEWKLCICPAKNFITSLHLMKSIWKWAHSSPDFILNWDHYAVLVCETDDIRARAIQIGEEKNWKIQMKLQPTMTTTSRYRFPIKSVLYERKVECYVQSINFWWFISWNNDEASWSPHSVSGMCLSHPKINVCHFFPGTHQIT